MITTCQKTRKLLEELICYLTAGSALILLTLIAFSCDEPLAAREGTVQTISVFTFRDV